jgi:hypothetical protein
MARPGLGFELIDRQDGDPEIKRRVRVCLATITGEMSVDRARRQVGLSKQGFHELRERIIQGAIAGGTPRPGGRPPVARDDSPAPSAALTAAQEESQRQARMARVLMEGLRVREELHAVLGGRLKPIHPERLAERFGVAPTAVATAIAAAHAHAPRPTEVAAVSSSDLPPPSASPPDAPRIGLVPTVAAAARVAAKKGRLTSGQDATMPLVTVAPRSAMTTPGRMGPAPAMTPTSDEAPAPMPSDPPPS